MSQPVPVKPIDHIAGFISDRDLNCEVFNPKNLRFITIDKARGLPTLYFEDEHGCKGRIRQAHKKGPAISFCGNSVRMFFSRGKTGVEKMKIAKTHKASLVRADGVSNFLVRDEGGTWFVPFSIDESEAPDVTKGMMLFEFYPKIGKCHESGGVIAKINDIDDGLIKRIIDLGRRGRGGAAVIDASLELFKECGHREITIKSVDHNLGMITEIPAVEDGDLSKHLGLRLKSAEALKERGTRCVVM